MKSRSMASLSVKILVAAVGLFVSLLAIFLGFDFEHTFRSDAFSFWLGEIPALFVVWRVAWIFLGPRPEGSQASRASIAKVMATPLNLTRGAVGAALIAVWVASVSLTDGLPQAPAILGYASLAVTLLMLVSLSDRPWSWPNRFRTAAFTALAYVLVEVGFYYLLGFRIG